MAVLCNIPQMFSANFNFNIWPFTNPASGVPKLIFKWIHLIDIIYAIHVISQLRACYLKDSVELSLLRELKQSFKFLESFVVSAHSYYIFSCNPTINYQSWRHRIFVEISNNRALQFFFLNLRYCIKMKKSNWAD